MHVIIQLTDRLEAKLGLHEEVLNKRRCDNLLYGRKKSFEIHALDDKASLEVNMVHRWNHGHVGVGGEHTMDYAGKRESTRRVA